MKAVLKTILAAMFFLLCACSQEGGLVDVKLNLSTEAKDLTVSSLDVPSVFEYRAYTTGETGTWTSIQGGQTQVVLNGFKPGFWTFEGRAYSSSNVLLYEGSCGVVLQNGVQNSVTISMRRTNITSSGTGTLSLTVQTPMCRDRTSESLQIKYRPVGTENYSSRLLTTYGTSGDMRAWTTSINSIPAGTYEVIVVLLNNQTEILGRAFAADIKAGKTCSVSGTLDGGPDTTTYTIELQLADIITLAENENCTKVITGLTDTFTGQDIDAAVIDKGGKYLLKYCSKNSIEAGDKLSTFGIQMELYDCATDPNADILCSKEFIMVTKDCTSLPSEAWFQTEYRSWSRLPVVRTMYVNKNLTGDYSISGVVHLTRLIIGNNVTTITGSGAICNTNALTVLSIPSSVTELGMYSIRVADGPESLAIYCSLSVSNVSKILKLPNQVVHTTGALPVSQL